VVEENNMRVKKRVLGGGGGVKITKQSRYCQEMKPPLIVEMTVTLYCKSQSRKLLHHLPLPVVYRSHKFTSLAS